MNELTYVATEMRHTENGRMPYGNAARVYVNGTWRFAIAPEWNGSVHVTVLTRTDENGNWQAAGFDLLAYQDVIDTNLTELAQLFPPF